MGVEKKLVSKKIKELERPDVLAVKTNALAESKTGS